MTIEINSTTDSKEAVIAALGDLAKPKDDVVIPEAKETESETKTTEDQSSEVAEGAEVKEPSESESEDESEEELEAKTEDDTEEQPKPKKGYKKRLDKLRDQKAELIKERDSWREQALRTQAPAQKTESTPVAKDLSLRPKNEDFETHDAYVEALTDWKLDQKLSQREQKQKEDVVKTQIESRVKTYKERAIAFAKANPEFDEVVDDLKGMTLVVNDSIIESEVGPEIAFYLGNNPDEFKRICSLTPLASAREMGKLEVRFSKTVSTASSETATTKAPKPVTTLRPRGAATSKDFDDPRSTQRDYEMAREKQIKQNSMRR